MRVGFGSVVVLLLVACETAADVDDTDDDLLPAIAGTYAVTRDTPTGCEPDDPTAFVDGPLTVTDGDGTVSFDFGEAAVFSGTADASFAFAFDGDLVVGDATATVAGDGVITETATGVLLAGSVTADLGDCVAVVDFNAVQDAP